MPKLVLFLILLFQPLLAVAADCTPTRQTFLGNNYKPITTQKTDVGEGLRIQGRVLARKNCQPIAGARIEHWQANAEGNYVDRLRAYLLSAEDGGYRFNTDWTGLNHIHFIVTAQGYKKLTTLWAGERPQDNQINLNFVLEPQ